MVTPFEQIAGLASLAWLTLLPILLSIRFYRNLRKGIEQPRREALPWTTHTASVVLTLVALTLVAIYTALSWVDAWGRWIGGGLAFMLLVVLLFGPKVFNRLDPIRRQAPELRDAEGSFESSPREETPRGT